MGVVLDPAEHLAAIDEAVVSAAGAPWTVRHYGEGQVVGNTILTGIERRFITNERALAASPTTGWRVLIEVVADYEANVHRGLALVATALDEVALVVGGEDTTPLLFEGGRALEPDGDASSATTGPFSALNTWTYIH